MADIFKARQYQEFRNLKKGADATGAGGEHLIYVEPVLAGTALQGFQVDYRVNTCNPMRADQHCEFQLQKVWVPVHYDDAIDVPAMVLRGTAGEKGTISGKLRDLYDAAMVKIEPNSIADGWSPAASDYTQGDITKGDDGNDLPSGSRLPSYQPGRLSLEYLADPAEAAIIWQQRYYLSFADNTAYRTGALTKYDPDAADGAAGSEGINMVRGQTRIKEEIRRGIVSNNHGFVFNSCLLYTSDAADE